MSGRQSESNQVTGRHDRHDDAAWFHYQPNAAAPASQAAGADTFVRETMTLTHTRPRSIPPNETGIDAWHENPWASPARSRSRSRSPNEYRPRGPGAFNQGSPSRSLSGGNSSRSTSNSNSRTHTSMDRARGAVDEKFTSSATGIGASIIGAMVGGFVASRASEALQNRGHRSGAHRLTDSDGSNVPRIASTILGAVAGGLGANVLANHLEEQQQQHDRGRDRPTWDRQYTTREDYDYRRTSGGRDFERDEEEYDFLHDAAEKGERRRSRSRDSDFRN